MLYAQTPAAEKRRLLRELATKGRVEGDITTLEDLGTIAKLREQDEQ